ncbi:MAG TPA: helix-turn-helix transcriptional regulator [Acidobacteriaceae bacterium]|nr:helix-turn-helix transcriptional regulator [Acidobacteriaceae bacterium]
MTPLLKARKMRGQTQRDVAAATGIDQAILSKIERSERSRAHPDKEGATAAHAAVLSRYFGHLVTEVQILYPADYLVDEADVAMLHASAAANEAA